MKSNENQEVNKNYSSKLKHLQLATATERANKNLNVTEQEETHRKEADQLVIESQIAMQAEGYGLVTEQMANKKTNTRERLEHIREESSSKENLVRMIIKLHMTTNHL